MDDFVWLGSCDCQLCRSCLGSHAAAYWRHMAEQLQAEVQPHSDSKQKQHTSLQYASYTYRSHSAGVAFVMGESVWWLSGFGACRAAVITKIDATGDPTSYEIQYAGEDRFRETIAKRLRHRVEPKLPDDTCKCPAPSCSANIAIAQLQASP